MNTSQAKKSNTRSKMKVSDEIVIEISNMNKWFGHFHVLRDIDLVVNKGERIVICGPSGSGKSTLIRCINRLEEHHNKEKFWSSPDMAVESAKKMLDLGFTALKFDPAGPYTIRGGHQPSMFDISLSIEFCNALRKAVGNKADLLFGTHGQFTTSGAIRLGKALEKYNLLWFEEPIPPDNIDEFKKVSEAVNIPIATGERHTTKSEFASLLKNGGVSILQPALGRSGGILETKKISAIAEVFNAQVAPHLYAGPVEWAANIQLASSIPNLLIAETILTGGEFHLKLIKNSIKWENGFILSPQAPGLGIEFDEQLANDNKYNGDKLHLEMQEEPCNYQKEL